MGGRGVVGRSSFASSNLSFDTPEHDRDSALAIARVHPPQHQPQQLHTILFNATLRSTARTLFI